MFLVSRAHRQMLLAGVGAAIVVSGLFVGAARAESLSEALATAYTTNPTIRAERARQRSTDEQMPAALSGWRPRVEATGQAGHQIFDQPGAKPKLNDPASLSIELSQPIFSGFGTLSSTAAADARVRAGRANLSSAEQTALLQAVAAYMNVVRDRRIVELRRQDLKVLEEQLNAANARFKVGEITRTDVAQARASLSQSQSNLALARAALASSEASYEQIIGMAPGTLTGPAVPGALPASLQDALATAEKANPDVLAALFIEEAARSQVGVVRSRLLPQASINAQYTTSNDTGTSQVRATQQSYFGRVSVPLYEGGEVYAGVREAKQVASQRRLQVIEAQRGVRQAVIAAWNNYLAAGESITASAEQVKASQLAIEGVRQEAMVGSRTTLDVLNAQQDVVNAEVRLAQAERDRIVAAYQVLATTGKLTPKDIGLPVDNYDPTTNYNNTRFKLIGTGVDKVE